MAATTVPLLGGTAGQQVASANARGMPLLLDVRLNGAMRGVRSFVWQDDALWATAQVLGELGFRMAPGVAGLQRIDALPGVTMTYDVSRQSVDLTAPLELLSLETTLLRQRLPPTQPAEASSGLLLNYDLYGMQARQRTASLSAFTELRAFSGNAVLSNTALMQRLRTGATDDDWRSQSVRLDTTWSYSLPDDMLTVRVGDTLTGALPWSRSTRIGGVQIARNFGLQPYRSTAPLPSFIGSATLPSDVELFIDGVRQFNGQVPAGPFRLDTLPRINASGQAQVVLTDALGRATTINFSLYDQGRLLAKDLTDWSVEVGWVRRNYGLRSFDYASDPALSGTWRRGLSDTLTLEAHGEATRGLALAGVGAVWQMGAAGLLSGGVSRSSHGGSGTLYHLGYSWSRKNFQFSLSGTRTQDDYRDVASLYSAPPPRGVGRASIGYSAGSLGSFNLSYLYLRQVGYDASRYASINWFRSIGNRVSVSVGVNQNLDRRSDRGVFVNVNWMLDSRTSTSASLQGSGHRSNGTVSAQQSAPTEGGWGWRAMARAGDDPGGVVQVEYLGRAGRLTAGVADYGEGSRYGYAGASGSVVLLGGHVFAARRIEDAFAVVSTDGVPGVPVSLENRPMGRTDERGVLLVTPVLAYQNNQVAIDPMNLPPEMRIDRTQSVFTPTDRAGAVVRFEMRPVRAASIRLVDAGGQPVTLGSRVTVEGRGAEPAMVGHDGLVYLEDLGESNLLIVHTRSGDCWVRVQWPDPSPGLKQIGPLPCVQGGAR